MFVKVAFKCPLTVEVARFEFEQDEKREVVVSVRVDGGGHVGSIQNVFDDFICSEIERIDGDELWACLSFVVMLEGGAMHGAKIDECGKR